MMQQKVKKPAHQIWQILWGLACGLSIAALLWRVLHNQVYIGYVPFIVILSMAFLLMRMRKRAVSEKPARTKSHDAEGAIGTGGTSMKTTGPLPIPPIPDDLLTSAETTCASGIRATGRRSRNLGPRKRWGAIRCVARPSWG